MYPPSKKYSYCKYMYMYTKNFKKYCNSDNENHNDRKGEEVHICPLLDNATLIMSDRVHIKIHKII